MELLDQTSNIFSAVFISLKCSLLWLIQNEIPLGLTCFLWLEPLPLFSSQLPISGLPQQTANPIPNLVATDELSSGRVSSMEPGMERVFMLFRETLLILPGPA